jgi:hypothetical protein
MAINMPLALMKDAYQHDKEHILLKFNEGDKENSFTWRRGWKAFITLLFCPMTVFIALATTTYSSGINRGWTALAYPPSWYS